MIRILRTQYVSIRLSDSALRSFSLDPMSQFLFATSILYIVSIILQPFSLLYILILIRVPFSVQV